MTVPLGLGAWKVIASLTLMVLGAQSCSSGVATSERSTFPARYSVRMEGDLTTVEVRFSLPDRSTRTLTTQQGVWTSRVYRFPAGAPINLSATVTDRSGDVLVDCQIQASTRSDPDGTVFGEGGKPDCEIRVKAGENPFEGTD